MAAPLVVFGTVMWDRPVCVFFVGVTLSPTPVEMCQDGAAEGWKEDQVRTVPAEKNCTPL